MKKIICLLLAAMMCVLLCACGGSENRPSQIPSENDTENFPVEEVKIAGKWKNIAPLNPGYVMIFNEDGTGSKVFDGVTSTFTWEKVEDVVRLEISGKTEEFSIVDGHLKAWGNHGLLISETEYDEKIEEIHITADNWQEYCEITHVKLIEKDDFGAVEKIKVHYYFSLKEQYAGKCAAADGGIIVSFGNKWVKTLEYNTTTGEFLEGELLTKDEVKAKYPNANFSGALEVKMSLTDLSSVSNERVGISGAYDMGTDKITTKGDVIVADWFFRQDITITKLEGVLYMYK